MLKHEMSHCRMCHMWHAVTLSGTDEKGLAPQVAFATMTSSAMMTELSHHTSDWSDIMTIRVEHDGITYVVDGQTEQEMEISLRVIRRALSGDFQAFSAPISSVRAAWHQEKGEDKRRVADKATRSINMLRVIREAGPEGVSSDEFVSKLNLKSVKSVGSESGILNAMLESIGLAREDVYSTVKSAREHRKFFAEAKIDLAIDKFQAMLGQQEG